MKKSLIILFVVLLPMISSVCAFSDWVQVNDSISFDGINYTVEASDKTGSVLVLNTKDSSIIIPYNETTIKGEYSYLYSEKEFANAEYLNANNITSIHSSENDLLKYYLEIKFLAPDISISKSLSRQELVFGDKFNVTYIISNPGDVIVKGKYTEKLPLYYKKTKDLILIINNTEEEFRAYQNPGEIIWVGRIREGDSITFVQEVQLVGTTSTNKIDMQQGVFDFEFLESNDRIVGTALSPTYILPISAEIEFDKSSYEIDEEGNVKITITKTTGSTVDIKDLNITMGGLATIEEYDEPLIQNNNKLRWKGKIDEPKEFNIRFNPIWKGNFTLKTDIAFTYKTLKDTESFEKGVSFDLELPKITPTVPTEVQSNEVHNVSITITSDSEYTFNSLKFDIKSPLFEDLHYVYTQIGKGTEIIRETEFKSPWVNKELEFPVYFTASYKSKYNQEFNEKINSTIKINSIIFNPAIGLKILNTSWSETIISNETRDATLSFGLQKLNDTAEPKEVYIKIDYENISFEIRPSNDELNGSVYNFTISTIRNMTTRPYVNTSIYYVDGDDVFYVFGRLDIPLPDDVEIKEAEPEEVKEETQTNFPFKKQEEPIVFTRNMMIIIGSVVGLGIFMLILYSLVSKGKGTGSSSGGVIIPQRGAVNTEQLLDETANLLKNGAKTLNATNTLGVPLPTPKLEILEKHINSSLASGISKVKIKTQLLETGWLEDVVDVYLKK